PDVERSRWQADNLSASRTRENGWVLPSTLTAAELSPRARNLPIPPRTLAEWFGGEADRRRSRCERRTVPPIRHGVASFAAP
ncbi:hypothetical protein J0J23_22695, partial [Vibrio vulnificus]|uniref:hypothetical protein n=1 Tax=Vibrio vulnificus TaxID=672 RepID=UPI0019D4C9B2